MDALKSGHPEAKAAMEMALFDIVGQVSGLPVAELLGGRCRDDIPLSFSVADPDFDRDMEMVQRLYGEGLRLFKMKTGFAGHAQDLKRMERFRISRRRRPHHQIGQFAFLLGRSSFFVLTCAGTGVAFA